MAATRINIQGLTKSYARLGRETVAVDGVDLSIEPGEIFFLLGPSGCGKTTLLRMIAGFINPTKGRILFDSEDVTWRAPHERRVGMVFQSYALWPHMSVFENVAFGLRMKGTEKRVADRNVRDALEIVQMGEYGERRPNELSGGQQQRVALARALVVEPRVLLLDEPLSNLDTKLRTDLRTEIRRVCKQAGTTTIYVTHDQKEALAVADRIAVMRTGRVCQLGSPQDLYQRPADTFVASFLGELNLIPGIVESESGRSRVLQTSFGKVVSDHPSAEKLAVGRNATIGIRPERIKLGVSGEFPSTAAVLTATYLGDVQQLRILAGSDEFRVTAPGSARFSDRQPCSFVFEPADVMCFARG